MRPLFKRSSARRLAGTFGPEGAGPDEETQRKRVEAAAVRLLARREHSAADLRRKLLSRGHPEPVVKSVIDKLSERRLVSDERFTGCFIHHHAQRGQGPVRIRAELRQQGVAEDAVESQLGEVEIDWVARARTVRIRKFGESLPADRSERAKQARFLQYRGFSSDQIRAALRSDVSDIGMDVEPEPEPDL